MLIFEGEKRWVIKLGGSLSQSAHLPLWLDALSQTNAIIVPGGGPFADAVREAQARWQFDDRTAHHMAILAMRQYGLMLAGMNPKLLTAGTKNLEQQADQSRVWLPEPEELDQAGIPATWDITSDSLAAWLAGRVRAENLLLVKSVELNKTDSVFKPKSVYSHDTLVKLGWVDLVFPEYAPKKPFQSWLCGPDAHTHILQALADPSLHFVPINH